MALMALEVAVGLVLGFVARLLFFATDLAGSIAAAEMGLNMASAFNPMTEKQVEAPGLMLYYLAGVLFLSLDLHHWLLVGFQRTYYLLPIGGIHLRESFLKDMLGFTGNIFTLALQMAAPLVAISFLVSLVFAVLSRAVPQMNVFSESFAFRALVGLAIFGLTLHLMAEHIMNFLRRLPEDFLRVAQALGGG
jgi:flagellar biosynthetic protein FliR